MIPTIGNRNPITNYLYSQIISQLQFFNIKEKKHYKVTTPWPYEADGSYF